MEGENRASSTGKLDWNELVDKNLRKALYIRVYRPDADEEGACTNLKFEAGDTLPPGLLQILKQDARWPHNTVRIKAYFEGESRQLLFDKYFGKKVRSQDPWERAWDFYIKNKGEITSMGGALKGISSWVNQLSFNAGKNFRKGMNDDAGGDPS